jgi:hypothetical protein
MSPTGKRALLTAAGIAAGLAYSYGLTMAGLAALLGAGGASLFMILAASPLVIGPFMWPVVGGLLAWRDRGWARVTVLIALTAHLAWALLAIALDDAALQRLPELVRVLPLETLGALAFYIVGQALAWWLTLRSFSTRSRANSQ